MVLTIHWSSNPSLFPACVLSKTVTTRKKNPIKLLSTTNKSLDKYFRPKNVRHMRNINFFVYPPVECCFKSTSSCWYLFLLLISWRVTSQPTWAGGGGEGHTTTLYSSTANWLLNNSAKYGDNFLIVDLPICKSLYTRLFSSPRPRKLCNPILVTPWKNTTPIWSIKSWKCD